MQMIVFYLASLGMLFLAYWLLKHYIADLRFYQRYQWNFHRDNPDAPKFQRGEFDERPISNRSRVLFAYPFFLIVTLFFMLGPIFLNS